MASPTNLPLHGSCLCGAVQVRVTLPPILTLACHCRDCQKLTASAYSLTAIVPSTGFSVSGGRLIAGGRKVPPRQHHYCSECLTFVYTQIDGKNERVNVRASLFDNATCLAPFVEVMTDEKLPWAVVPAAHSFKCFPATNEEFAALASEYKAWWQSQT